MTLANRYRVTIGLTLLCFFKSHKRRFRRSVFLLGATSWFLIPEWPMAYLNPEKSIIDLQREMAEKEALEQGLELKPTTTTSEPEAEQ